MDTDVTKNRSGLTKTINLEDHGISVSYGRVMEVKRGVARAVCARSPQGGSVVPSNSRFNGRIRLVKFRPAVLGSAHLHPVKMLLTEADQSNGKFCPRANWKHYLYLDLTCLINYH